MPDHVTHYHRASRPPFLNLGDLEDAAADEVVRTLGAETGTQRVFGPRYLALRRLTEARLRELFVAAGGRPERTSPHYFVLGESAWFAGLADDLRAVRIPLSDLPEAVTSLTVADSVEAMALGAEFGLTIEPQAHHGRVFGLAELPEVIAAYGLPENESTTESDYAGYHRRPLTSYVEVQLWSDAPVRRWLRP